MQEGPVQQSGCKMRWQMAMGAEHRLSLGCNGSESAVSQRGHCRYTKKVCIWGSQNALIHWYRQQKRAVAEVVQAQHTR